MVNIPWSPIHNLLCIRLDSLGDVVMTTPAFRAIKEAHPQCKITLLTSPEGSRIASLVPTLNTVIPYDAPWMKAALPRPSSQREFALLETLQHQKFDSAIIFTVYSQNPLPAALICYLAEIPLRLAHCHENPYQLLTHWIPDPEPGHEIRHEVRRQLDLISSVGIPIQHEDLHLQLPTGLSQQIQQQLKKLGIDLHRPWVVIHPGASAPARRYPARHFSQVARCLVKESQIQVLFTGSPLESALVEDIRQTMKAPSFSLTGQLTLSELTALLALSPLLISNNTGPVHLAAAMGTPVVDLYALTNPQHTPWRIPHRLLFEDVPCKYCYKSICPLGHQHCLSLVRPESVVQAVHELAAETGVFSSDFRRSL